MVDALRRALGRVLARAAFSAARLWVQGPRRPGVVVLGSELAAAMDAERARVAAGPERPSPLEGKRYDRWAGQLRLTKVERLPLDEEIAELARAYRAMDDEGRSSLRDSLSLEDFYTLFTFAKRNAVFVLRREGNIVDGLTAVAMIERARMDERDVSWVVAVLKHASVRTSADTRQSFSAAASLAEPPVAAEIRRATRWPSRHGALCNTCLHAEVMTPLGIGLASWSGKRYEPTIDLASLALDFADFCDSVEFIADDPELGEEVPDVWFKDSSSLKRDMREIRAVAWLHADARPERFPDVHEFERPRLMAWIAELSTPDAARHLLRHAPPTNRDPHRRGIAVGRLFGLIIGRSPMEGAEFPDAEPTMEAFAAALTQRFEKGAAF